MQLRPYQLGAVNSVWEYLDSHDTGNPLVEIPTGGGKSLVMATLCEHVVKTWNRRALVLAHVKELIEQTADEIRAIAPDLPLGIYSAGLGRKDIGYAVTVAGIQSICDKACKIKPPDIAIIDEAHLVPFDGEGQYRSFLFDLLTINPDLRVVGLTATPYRMRGGMLCAKGNLFTEICYSVGVRELIVGGYLSPLRTRSPLRDGGGVDFDAIEKRGGEFVSGSAERAMDHADVVSAACREIVELTAKRKSVLVFTCGISHGEHVTAELRNRGQDAEFVAGDSLNRDESAAKFKAGQLKYLVNVNVFTTGFNARNVDCVVLLRPTMSPGLYYQMVGRGFRLSPETGKADCLVLDFGGNILRHGPVDEIKVRDPKASRAGAPAAKECPECHELISCGYSVCPACGHEFLADYAPSHATNASDAPIMSDQVIPETHMVMRTLYFVHKKKGSDDNAPKTMRVDYEIGFNNFASEWVCFEHEGFARQKACAWWRQRSNAPIPSTSAEACDLAQFENVLAPTLSIVVERRPGDKFTRIVRHELGFKPEYINEREPESNEVLQVADGDEVPF